MKGTLKKPNKPTDCGCLVSYTERKGWHLNFCPLHAAALAMKEALEAALMCISQMRPRTVNMPPVCEQIRAVLALAQKERRE